MCSWLKEYHTIRTACAPGLRNTTQSGLHVLLVANTECPFTPLENGAAADNETWRDRRWAHSAPHTGARAGDPGAEEDERPESDEEDRHEQERLARQATLAHS